MDVREQITALREQLRYHNEKYYNEDAPEITDYVSVYADVDIKRDKRYVPYGNFY